jgi:hypothetical protein
MSNNKYCLHCYECEGKKSIIKPNNESDYCAKCICNYEMTQCGLCCKYKPRSLFDNDDICTNCKLINVQCCKECDNYKPLISFLTNDQYCTECFFTMMKKCIRCEKKYKYYQLDNGKYCICCQQNMLLECNNCKNKKIYSDFYYTKTRIWCKKCVIKNYCNSFDVSLIKYEPLSHYK